MDEMIKTIEEELNKKYKEQRVVTAHDIARELGCITSFSDVPGWKYIGNDQNEETKKMFEKLDRSF